MHVLHFLHARGHTYHGDGSYWTNKFMAWIHAIQLDQPNDEHVLRGELADIAYTEARIQDLEQQI